MPPSLNRQPYLLTGRLGRCSCYVHGREAQMLRAETEDAEYGKSKFVSLMSLWLAASPQTQESVLAEARRISLTIRSVLSGDRAPCLACPLRGPSTHQAAGDVR